MSARNLVEAVGGGIPAPKSETELLILAEDLLAGLLEGMQTGTVTAPPFLAKDIGEWLAFYNDANPVSDEERSNGPRR